MDISLADERALLLKEQLSIEQAEGRAWGKKMEAFGRMARVTSFLNRPKDDDFELIYKEHRYEPFWHVVCSAHYVYERARNYNIELKQEVEAVTIEDKRYQVVDKHIVLTGLEHCREEPRLELFIDGFTGEHTPELAAYLNYPTKEIPQDDLDDISATGPIFVPPQARASGIVRNVLSDMIKGVQADRVLEEYVHVERVDLYYRPVYAFQYRWVSKDKESVLEYDAVTSQLEADGKTFQQYMGKMLDPNF
ncbi:MAG: hypothetical protein KDE51_24910, partial [Anaerolineales bacterium]|nr:hypothetical protein [Anaerolineales bacterium]